ncbi:IclR family transcriptional regulator [Ochrobactrum sp. C6C9]|uniref:IclR family transcriptional regulator n=1 Tax=Ochrobactrum sp. C6C9 TaxID=2736662 RepID=UPI0035304250|nr:IclR family transcriptional regulator [Ochrobactrum sp. C6C9]
MRDDGLPMDEYEASNKLYNEDLRNPLYNNSLAKGLQLLEIFTSDHRGMSLPEIANAAGITKSSAQRSVFTLISLGYLAKDPQTQRYVLTAKILSVGCNYLRKKILLEVANPHLHRLNKDTGETVNLAESWGSSVIYIARFVSANNLVTYMNVGAMLPMYCSSSGRAIMSTYPDEKIAEILSISNIISYTEKTILNQNEIFENIHESRNNGFAITLEEYFPDDLSLASPIVDVNGIAVGAVNVSVPASKWKAKDAIATFVPQLKRTAFAISSSLGSLSPALHSNT